MITEIDELIFNGKKSEAQIIQKGIIQREMAKKKLAADGGFWR